MANYISTQEFATYYPSVDLSAYSDTTLSGLITQASASVDNYLGYSPSLENISNEITQQYVNSGYSFQIFPRKIPVNSISSLSIVKGATSVDINLNNNAGNPVYTIPAFKNQIVIPIQDITYSSFTILDWRALRTTDFYVKLSYNAGYAVIPEPIKQATAMYLMDIVTKRYNLAGANSVSQGGISISYSGKYGKGEFIQDAESLLQFYKMVI